MPIEPIKPRDVISAKVKSIPPQVIEAFNELITERFLVGRANFNQDEVIERILSKFPKKRAPDRSHIFASHWLDVEDVYRQQGWKVEYDKPGYAETYPATFTFTG
jgi:hypothetical protein